MSILRRPHGSVLVLLAALVPLLPSLGCEPESKDRTAPPATSDTAADPGSGPLRAVVATPRGRFTIEFRPEAAPLACASFVNLVQRRFFDGLEFYRHSPVIRQAGNPYHDDDRRFECGYAFMPEFSPDLRFDKAGMVGLVRRADNVQAPVRPNEFFVTTKPQTERFTFTYPIFAEVVDGQDVVNALPEGERIDTIRLQGDPKAILEPHAAALEVWNDALDRAEDPRG